MNRRFLKKERPVFRKNSESGPFFEQKGAPPEYPALLKKMQKRYLWKKNFMHQQNTGTMRMTM